MSCQKWLWCKYLIFEDRDFKHKQRIFCAVIGNSHIFVPYTFVIHVCYDFCLYGAVIYAIISVNGLIVMKTYVVNVWQNKGNRDLPFGNEIEMIKSYMVRLVCFSVGPSNIFSLSCNFKATQGFFRYMGWVCQQN